MCGKSGQGGLSTEAVAGVAIAAVTVALLLVALTCWACFKKRRERQIRAQRDSDSRRVYKEQHVELQQSTDSCSQHAQPAKVDKSAIAAVSSLQALSQQDTSQHSGPGQAAAATAGPPATNGGQPLPSVEAEPDSLVSNWLNKLTQTKIMNWLHQEQAGMGTPGSPSRHMADSMLNFSEDGMDSRGVRMGVVGWLHGTAFQGLKPHVSGSLPRA